MKHLIVDGYLSGTGIRNKTEGGYISPQELGISRTLTEDIRLWLDRYWNAFYAQYRDREAVKRLDEEGRRIAARLQAERPDDKIEYFSDAEMVFK